MVYRQRYHRLQRSFCLIQAAFLLDLFVGLVQAEEVPSHFLSQPFNKGALPWAFVFLGRLELLDVVQVHHALQQLNDYLLVADVLQLGLLKLIDQLSHVSVVILRIPRSSDDHCQGLLEFVLELGTQFVVVEHVDEPVEGVGDALSRLLSEAIFAEDQKELGFSDLFEDGLEEVGDSDDSDVVS